MYDVLQMLRESPGEVVTREELQKEDLAGGHVLDFD